MRKIMLDIPDSMDREIAVWLLCSDLEPRDKSRAILYAMGKLILEDAPEELKTRCRIAKDSIRAKAKESWIDRKAYNKAIDEEKI
jgi:hypothetical protein